VVKFTPQLLDCQGKIPQYPFNRRLGGLQSESGCPGDEKTAFPLPGIESHISQSVAYSVSFHTPYTRKICVSLGREYIVYRKRPQYSQSTYQLGNGS